MASVNKVIIVGNLGRDPEARQAGSATVCNFSVACSEKFKDRSGETQERTEWINIVAWGRLAEVARDYLRKGSSVYVEGKLQTRKWQDKNGADRWTTEVVASTLQMLDRKGGNGGGDRRPEPASSSYYDQPQASSYTDVSGEDESLPF